MVALLLLVIPTTGAVLSIVVVALAVLVHPLVPVTVWIYDPAVDITSETEITRNQKLKPSVIRTVLASFGIKPRPGYPLALLVEYRALSIFETDAPMEK